MADVSRDRVRVAILHALRVAVERSPVDKGALRNNWQVGTSPDIPEVAARDGGEGDPPSVQQFLDADSALARRVVKWWLVNPMPYAEAVDQGTPYTNARPMTEPAVAAARTVLNQK